MLMGEFHHNIDEKGRLIMPSKMREELGTTVVVTKGMEDALFVYSLEEWNQIVSKLKSLPFTKKDARNFTRIFLSGAAIVEFDKQGRIKLSSHQIEYANIKKECVIIGVNDRLEIWSKENWEGFIMTNKEELGEIADNLFEINFEI